MSVDASELILLGKVTKPHGIRGELRIFPYSGDPATFAASYDQLYLKGRDGGYRRWRVQGARVHKQLVLVTLEGCTSRNRAEELAGSEVYIRQQDLPEAGEDEFYLFELQDRDLVDIHGRLLGRSHRILDSGGQVLLVVNRGGKEILIPVVDEFIVAIEEDRVVLDLPPGLLELNG